MSLLEQTRLPFPQCPFCRDSVRPADRKVACDACMTWHHDDCWQAFQGRCSACHGGRAAGVGARGGVVHEEASPAVGVRAAERERAWDLAGDPREEVSASGLLFVGILLVGLAGIGLPLLLIVLLRG